MACFLVPAAEAVISTAASKVMQSKESSPKAVPISLDGSTITEAVKTPFFHKLKWLNNLLWGGSALLAFEHIWHGEVVPWFPFLSAASNPSDAAEMLYEMSTAGVAMAVLVTAVWGGMLAISAVIEKGAVKSAELLSPPKWEVML
ncbi:hypothetical protein D7X87_02320 [bacterium D16-54]|nr:hypothetical protein D7X87_02320 [bacterium D16-54]RKJ16485.1 hypothetical protein D7X65_02320 [bacterium D16-56]